jgi:hypothetical protein
MDVATVVGSLATLASTTSFAPHPWRIIETLLPRPTRVAVAEALDLAAPPAEGAPARE